MGSINMGSVCTLQPSREDAHSLDWLSKLCLKNCVLDFWKTISLNGACTMCISILEYGSLIFIISPLIVGSAQPTPLQMVQFHTTILEPSKAPPLPIYSCTDRHGIAFPIVLQSFGWKCSGHNGLWVWGPSLVLQSYCLCRKWGCHAPKLRMNLN